MDANNDNQLLEMLKHVSSSRVQWNFKKAVAVEEMTFFWATQQCPFNPQKYTACDCGPKQPRCSLPSQNAPAASAVRLQKERENRFTFDCAISPLSWNSPKKMVISISPFYRFGGLPWENAIIWGMSLTCHQPPPCLSLPCLFWRYPHNRDMKDHK